MQLDWKSKSRAISAAVGARAKYAGRMAKLTVAINAEQDAVQDAFREIGRLYYENHCDHSDPLLSQLCDEIHAAHTRIAELQGEMDALRASLTREEVCT